ncbi:uncharacterized protein LOC116416500 [Nasonia vitripennis]|uniref:DNA-directed DNA polymerase n=1 Tax=Nasonia vitripennis TaxID=7425 RepID=A0A7M7Q3Q0_NASVI|nr:uncharacterized protein LOC116416500 [Nasonia vitripennis]
MNALTASEREEFERARVCHICRKPFSAKDTKVKDHCHLTGRYRGPAHNKCNINYNDSRTIPRVIFHNLSGYDCHLFIKEKATCFKGRVSLIPHTKERYISFSKFVEGTEFNIRFIDSYRFMASSLEKLAFYLEKLSIAEEEFQLDYTTDQTELLKRKGVFPYDYISCFDKLKETELPTKEEFYNKLNDSYISDDDYEHAKAVWQAFDIQTLGEYSDLYLKTDVLLHADVFENFRDNCLEAYGLDPAYYYTTPGLTWDAMLKYTNIELELLTDVDMLLFVEWGIRGGVSQCSNRYAKANNRYMGETYNEIEESKYLVYYDVNNLYGWAMRECLPYGGFKWVNVAVETSDFFQVPDDHPVGYILEVDLEYPEALHDAHKDLPLCPERMPAPGTRQEKLMTTLHDKERYVIHYRSLKQALKHGLRLKKIHRVLKFDQRVWLRSYIDLNSEKRKQAKNDFEKLLYKLFNNAIYGKTMENERKRIDVKLVTKWCGRYGAEALVAKPNFHSCCIFEENLVAVELARTEITVRKPMYIGLCVLDLSKSLVYDFHYEYIRDRVGDRCKLLYTDTDSLVYEVTDLNMYEAMRQDIDHFDTSDYPETNQFGIPRANKEVVGLMKDECCGRVMTEFVGLRSKMYTVKNEGQDVIKKAKGVKADVSTSRCTQREGKQDSAEPTRQQALPRPRRDGHTALGALRHIGGGAPDESCRGARGPASAREPAARRSGGDSPT